MSNAYVLDTNTVISALFWPDSLPAKACHKAQTGKPVISQAIVEEWRRVIHRPKFDKLMPLDQRSDRLETFIDQCTLITVNQVIRVCRDPKDDMFLSLAKEANATLIVSGDKDLLTLHPFDGIPIITARVFLDMR
ncbi:putative PIN family toxin of toxin-antitoxin system [Spirosoma oryzae]|uniref:Putative PIN family toxin of toxin-antitoxin system n=1 Tax=Spirosoma oryzae TaxID=1469603 RepID=A0A2T0SMI9_9BACT|nr:putative toxin-antitoxin system toxin component, PIN family [Spirosoma oryzae]PRY34624.1 putative PIN family toxin of toxin-antitoxin system [Spirosoma oryzae]